MNQFKSLLPAFAAGTMFAQSNPAPAQLAACEAAEIYPG